MIKRQWFLSALLILIADPGFSFSCFYTAVKANCWQNYEITISVIDPTKNVVLAKAIIPKGKLWTRISFTCNPSQELNYTAVFQPTIWEGQEKKIYSAQHYWRLPDQIKAGSKAWNIPVCFPDAFAQVPMPPQATSICSCDLGSIPPVPPQP